MILGIELGSTRIKSVLIDHAGQPIATGAYSWENTWEGGYWTYSEEEIWKGLRESYADLKRSYESRFQAKPANPDAIGISAMMHGYLAFDERDELLVPFRTWRNTNTREAAELLSRRLDFNMPLRWSASHLLQAVLNGEEHIGRIHSIQTLAGYVHYKLTGERVLGVGDASGIFPVKDGRYDAERLAQFNGLLKEQGFGRDAESLFPAIRQAGSAAGRLTEEGARRLDPTGELAAGIPFCPPEGDAGTGMVATNSVRRGTGNVSAGTSAFAMIVLDRPLSKPYPEVDIVTTPDGADVAMIHVNNCTSEINAWAELLGEAVRLGGGKLSHGELLTALFEKSRESQADLGGLTCYSFLSGEHVWGLEEGRPMVMREPSGKLTLADLMRAQIYSAVVSLRKGMDILAAEGVSVAGICGHGGFFKTPVVGQAAMSAALRTPVTVMQTAGEGGAYGMALLALYYLRNAKERVSLSDFLDGIFASAEKTTVMADDREMTAFQTYLERFEAYMPAERIACRGAVDRARPDDRQAERADAIRALKKRVYEQNLALVKHGLVILTWGNVSAIDRELGVVVIKPSGVSYDTMTEEDMVVLDTDGRVLSGGKPSSDTPTHLFLYRAFPEIGGVVHTHSAAAVAWAQAGRDIPAYGTTHADAFFGDVPCARSLTAEEIQGEYERNTGAVIAETYVERGLDPLAVPAVLVKDHGPFTFGKTPEKAVENAVTLEAVATMATYTEAIRPDTARVDQALMDKHYFRKHGKNAYYGQT